MPSAPKQRAVIFLLAVQRAAPLPVAHDVGAMSDGVPRHRPHFSFVERVVDGRPVHRAGLGLHHPEILALEAASQVVGKAVPGRIEMSLADVVVPGGEIEIFFDYVVIEAVIPAHCVCGDELPGSRNWRESTSSWFF